MINLPQDLQCILSVSLILLVLIKVPVLIIEPSATKVIKALDLLGIVVVEETRVYCSWEASAQLFLDEEDQ